MSCACTRSSRCTSCLLHLAPMAARLALLLLFITDAANAAVVTKNTPKLNNQEALLAGGTARFGAQLIMYPADALRTLAQTRTGAKTLQELGVWTLVSGCFTTSTFAFAVGGLQFSIFGALRQSVGPIGASMCASLGSSVAGVPQEVIKQRLVTGIYPNFRTAVGTIFKDKGLMGFYEGGAPTITRNLPFIVITFCSMDALKERFKHSDGTPLTTVENVLAGVSSALVGGLCTQPIDVIKTRLMTQAATSAVPYTGVVDCVRTMLTTEGPGVFLAGLRPRMAYLGPLWALQFGLNGVVAEAIQKKKKAAAAAPSKR